VEGEEGAGNQIAGLTVSRLDQNNERGEQAASAGMLGCFEKAKARGSPQGWGIREEGDHNITKQPDSS
jgi:hypothetical protein